MKWHNYLSKSFAAVMVRIGIALAAILITIWSQWQASPFESFLGDEWLRDRFIRMAASAEPEQRIAIIDIDEASLAALGPWPWPRTRIAELVETLIDSYDARGVALDLVLPEAADESGDMRLAVLAEHGPVVLAQVFDYAPRSAPLQIGKLGNGRHMDGYGRNAAPGPVASGYIGNHPGMGGARHVGNIGFVPDLDGAVRHLPLETQFDEKSYPTLTKSLLECCWKSATQDVDSERLAENTKGFWRIPYQRQWSAYTVVPAADIVKQSAPTESISGRLVLIGSSSLGLTDRVWTPLATSNSGVLVHAAALTSLLDHQEGKGPAHWPGQWLAVLFTALVTLTAAYTFPRLSALVNVGILMLASAAWVMLAYFIAPHDPAFSTTGPLISNAFLLAVAVPLDWQLTQRKSRQLLGTLRQYVAKAVVDELLRRDLDDPLTPQHLEVTTLIADMEGYTGQVESLTMEEAAQLTRDFLACLTRPVLEHHGTLDKFTGDGLVAFWGAPLPVEDHADLAIDAARKMIEAVRQLSNQREQCGKRPLRVRIGIESGLAMAGNFGSSSRSIYTAVGDSVNVASRLEQLAREYPYNVIIGQGTVKRSRRHAFKFLGERLLRGKGNPTALHTLEDLA